MSFASDPEVKFIINISDDGIDHFLKHYYSPHK